MAYLFKRFFGVFGMKVSKNIFYITITLILVINVGFLIYYAYHIPLHIDEAGWWFNYTNKSWQNRFNTLDPMRQFNGPFHTLSTYLPKLTLPIFGQNGVGWRIPVVAFGLLACWIIYYFIKTLTNSGKTAGLGAALTLLNPFLNHYAHESRSYVMLLFFSTCSYLCLFKLLGGAWNRKYWGVLFLLFLLSYMATLSAVVFLFIFMSSLWVLKILYHFTPIKKNINSLINIEFSHLIVFSIFSSLFFVCLVFYLDYSAFSVGQYYQGNRSANLIAIPDFFSAFLGYKYLDDVTSTIYHYPVEIYGVSVFCFAVGFIYFFREKQIHTYFFIALFLSTAGFYIFSGSHIYTRTGVFLIPFLIFYQAKGVMFLTEAILYRLFHREQAMNICCWVLSGVVIFYCATFNFGKYRNLEPDSGNPYELARSYLKNNAGPNDLIISNLYPTLGNFYFGQFIRKQNKNIFQGNQLGSIYYLTPNKKERAISLPNLPLLKKHKLIRLNKRLTVKSFTNEGVRGSYIDIYKIKVDSISVVNLTANELGSLSYFGNGPSNCKTTIRAGGFSISCAYKDSPFACSTQPLVSPKMKQGNFQMALFHHNNKNGTKKTSMALVNSLGPSFDLKYLTVQFFEKSYLLNNLIADERNLDLFQENVEQLVPSVQKIKTNKNILFCMVGKLFNDNSIIKGIKIYDFKIQQSSSPDTANTERAIELEEWN